MSETATETNPAGTETPPAPPATDPATPPATDPAAPPAEDDGSDPRVTRANREAANYRTQLRAVEQQLADAQAAQQTQLDGIAKALGLKGADEGADPAQQVTELTGQVQTLTETNRQLQAELLVHTLAGDPEVNANPVKLLDSRTFTTTLAGLDPAAEDYRAQVAKAITDAVASNPTFAAAQVASRGGAETAGQGAGGSATVTADQFKSMSYADKAELFRTNPALYRELAG